MQNKALRGNRANDNIFVSGFNGYFCIQLHYLVECSCIYLCIFDCLGGTYSISQGCWSSNSCSATTTVNVMFNPTEYPSPFPSFQPSPLPSAIPSPFPSFTPTYFPTYQPSQYPSRLPTATPTMTPSAQPTYAPSPGHSHLRITNSGSYNAAFLCTKCTAYLSTKYGTICGTIRHSVIYTDTYAISITQCYSDLDTDK